MPRRIDPLNEVRHDVFADGSGEGLNVLQYNPDGVLSSHGGGSHYVSITTAATTTVPGAPIRLCCIHVVGTGGTLGAITVYDNTAASGTVIFSQASPLGGDIYDVQVPIVTGITVVTAAATTLLVTYE